MRVPLARLCLGSLLPAAVLAADWETKALLVADATLAGPDREPPPALEAGESHFDPVRGSLAFGGAEFGMSALRPVGQGFVEVIAVAHVHRHPGEPTETELEEVCAEWSEGALRLRAGVFFAPLGATNLRHAHTWSFANAPLLHGRFLGESGLRNPGVQVGWAGGGVTWLLAIQRATGDTAASFRSGHEGEDYLGRLHSAANGSGPLVTLRRSRAYELGEGQSAQLGLSVATAQNGSGESARTWLAALDVDWKRERAAKDGWDRVELELLVRSFEASAGVNAASAPVSAETVSDAAVALSLISTLGTDWTASLRMERAVPLGRADYEALDRDPLRETRTRISPTLAWEAAPGLLLRLQYDHDRSPAFGTEDALWLVAQWQIGGH